MLYLFFIQNSIISPLFVYILLDASARVIFFNPTPVGGGRFPPPYRKMAITPKNNDPKELKLRDFSYITMTKWRKKGFLEHFCCQRY